MRRSPIGPFFAALLYGAIALTANGVAAAELSDANRAALRDMRTGDMQKLVVLDEPRDRIEAGFVDLYGNRVKIADFAGKVVLLNFWASWCPPCLAEMPSIDALAGDLQGDDFAVVAISSDRAGAESAQATFDDLDVENLKVYHDRSRDMGRQAGVLGLPVTLILDRQGREIARVHGDADWNSPETRALIQRVIEMTGTERV